MPVELVELVSVAVSLLTALLGVLSSTSVTANVAYKVLKWFQSKKLAAAGEPTTITVSTSEDLRAAIAKAETVQFAGNEVVVNEKCLKASNHVLKRLTEANNLKRQMSISATVYHWSERLFTLTQYVVGGALTTTFVKQQLSPQFIGVCGLLVVTVSALNQKLNPGANAQTAAQQADQLDTLIREIEDQVIVIQTTKAEETDPKPFNDLSKKVTSEIGKIKSLSRAAKRRNRNPSS